jgi:hypothetical protein
MHIGPFRRILTVGALIVFCAGIALLAQGRAGSSPSPNTLSPEERAQGWRLLFDGASFAGWRGLGYDGVPKGHWTVENGAIHKVAARDVPAGPDGQPLPGGDLMTAAAFRDFELAFEWKVASGANSGVKYDVSEELSRGTPPRGHAALGFEYQVLDDDLHEDARNGPNRTAGALYDLLGPSDKRLRPVGEYNEARIVFKGTHGEHWLNGRKVLEFDLGTPDFAARLAASKFKAIAGFAEKRSGHIVLQDHGDAVWFRSLKIRVLK